MKQLTSFLWKHYEMITIAAICAYLMASLVVVTMLNYIPLISLLVKLGRYGLYVLLLALWIFHFVKSEDLHGISKSVRSLLVYLLDHLLCSFLMLSCILIYFFSRSLVPFAIGLLLMAASTVSREKLLKAVFLSQLVCMIVIIAASQVGLLEDLLYATSGRGTRHSLGYIYPLEMHSHFFFLFLLGVWVYQKYYGWIAFGIISVLNYFIYQLTIARTNLVLVWLAALLCLIAVKVPKKHMDALLGSNWWKIAYSWGLIVVFLLPVAAALAYNPHIPFWDHIDNLLTGRLALSKNALETWPIPLFGQQIQWLGSGGSDGIFIWMDAYNFVDNSYIKDLLDYGIVLYVFTMLGYNWLLSYFSKTLKPVGVAAIACILAAGMMEPRLLAVNLNFYLLFLAVPFMASNLQVSSWFGDLCFAQEYKALKPAGKKLALAAGMIALICSMLYFRQLHIYGARRAFADNIETGRMNFVNRINELEVPEGADPYVFSRLKAAALRQTSGYYDNLVREIPLHDLDSFYIDDALMDEIRQLDGQKLETRWLEWLCDPENISGQSLELLESLNEDPALLP